MISPPQVPPPSANVKVSKSSIHGKGVFALRNFNKGDYIIQYTGQKISKKEGTKRSMHEETTYIFILDDVHDLDGNAPGYRNESRFINHCCAPNAEYVNIRVRGKGNQIWIKALKNIKRGDEITYDYRLDSDTPQWCNCGKDGCRQVMNAEDWSTSDDESEDEESSSYEEGDDEEHEDDDSEDSDCDP